MNKENGDRLIDGEQMTASWGWGRGVEGWSKKGKGLMDTDNSVMIAGGGSIRGCLLYTSDAADEVY